MTSYDEEYTRAKENRSSAMLSVKSIRNLKAQTEFRKTELLPILFGADSDYGILTVIALYMEQSRLTAGRKTSTPDFSSDYKSQYLANLALCVTGSGDGEGGLYPPEMEEGKPTSKAQKEFNANSIWLNSFSLESVSTATGVGIKQRCLSLRSAIGVAAISNSDRRGPYSSKEEADSRAETDRGSGYLALRTENSEVYSESSGDLTNWYIGRDGIDTPDNYSFKEELLSHIDLIVTSLEEYTDNLKKSVTLLSEENPILEEFKVSLPEDLTRLQERLEETNSAVDKFSEIKTFFAEVDPLSSRGEINLRLENLSSYLEDLASQYEHYSEEGSLSLGTVDSGTRKNLAYWVEELVKKPDGVFSTLEGIPTLLEDAENKLALADNKLNSFSTDKNSWIQTPSIVGVFNQAILNLDKTVKRWETAIIWSPILAANKYKILKKEITSFEGISNDPWTVEEFAIVENLNESGFLYSEKIISPPSVNTLFRVLACDEEGNSELPRIDSFNSYSYQSDVISGELKFSKKESSGNSCFIMEEKISLREKDFLILDDSTLAQIISVSENEIELDSDYGEVRSMKKLIGFFFSS